MPEITYDRYFAVPVPSDPVTIGCECLKCGALVQNTATTREMHKEWHLQIDELIDWARAVSAIFVPKEETNGEAPSPKL